VFCAGNSLTWIGCLVFGHAGQQPFPKAVVQIDRTFAPAGVVTQRDERSQIGSGASGPASALRNLNQQPCHHRVGDRDFVNIAPLQFGKDVVHLQRPGFSPQ
jgi:hypothetical protein